MKMPELPYIHAVYDRQYRVFRKLLGSALVSNVANPILFLFAFGFGMGSFIDTMAGMSYMTFVVAGMVGYSAAFAASFETSIGAFTRYFLQKNWDAILSTPVTLAELMMGEVLWASVKALFSAICVLIVGWMWGGVPVIFEPLITLPIVFLGSICFACAGLVATAYAKGYEFFAYFFTFWVTPMFVFCGVFFEISRFPDAVQYIAWFFPMTHLIAAIRPLIAGTAIDPALIALHTAYIVIFSAAAFAIAHRKLRQRLYD
ncbi:MAG: nodulation protein NodJ [Sneathiella sp.]|uniref:ABC transporter permease n=1 Tax=Sneathiella sp. TaxID=1964365 RepID=UPI000C5B723F|nr:ABC transporter permease [Sneathiella sp.]MAZ02730.1 nodulation protein NodJ [Sneathiella sp.]